ncbi:PhzF family phenazine biosynthesis protein [Roseococcus sp. SDR]|uniref:PhzF family phenazine biosynthesis protein n=1 Tax=Roseococcus sp. SDR TaxID=2835532 RepID=UPI001BCECB46|nr:PhzF family phenazine biosynthesis protein [Roseococcus sp. SDR]MBS7791872.1 PhzF family phenazine biosynthesis protein [Roseococcus sp. SDR]MBV1847186.1 PhzF family phenazine biosynthesis protein [Roseococcus sp. SDR]
MDVEFETCDVFTTARFGGNPLALVYGADGLEDAALQAIAREFNLSETVFVLPPEREPADVRLRIFTPGMELPFAGHPNVGAAVMIARRIGHEGDQLVLEQPAGHVTAWLTRGAGGLPVAAEIEAPRPLTVGATFDRTAIAACAALPMEAIHVNAHPPLMAGCGAPFAIAEVEDVELLAAATPDIPAMRQCFGPLASPPVGLLLHTPLGVGRRRVRMFAPLNGIVEDPATGGANVALAGLLLQLAGGSALALEVEQGADLGRPSLLVLAARRELDGTIRVRVGGGVVPVSRGVMSL